MDKPLTTRSYSALVSFLRSDVIPVVLLDAFTSILAGAAVFSVLGYIAHTQNTDIANVVSQGIPTFDKMGKETFCVRTHHFSGPGLVFSVYPEAISTMRLAPLWSVLFFVMILFLGIDSQVRRSTEMITLVSTTYLDDCPIVVHYGRSNCHNDRR